MRLVARAGLLVLCAVLLVVVSRVGIHRSSRPYPAPDFTLPDFHGNPVRLSDFKGKAVVLNFWATRCAPCRVEIPWFIEFEEEYGPRGLEVIGVDMDQGGWNTVEPFVKNAGMNYTVLLDDGRASAAYGAAQLLPTTYYISRDGRVAAYVRGLAGKSEVERNIEEILRPPGSTMLPH